MGQPEPLPLMRQKRSWMLPGEHAAVPFELTRILDLKPKG
jgi:hypothetical protein